MKHIDYEVLNGQLSISGRLVSFPKAVTKVISVDSKLIVMTERMGLDRNIFGVDGSGKILWQIELCPDGGDRPKPYTNIILSEQGEIIAGNWIGCEYKVNLGDGSVKAWIPPGASGARPW